MAALTTRRVRTYEKFSSRELVGKAEAVFEGGIACFDTSTGLVAKAFASATLIPIGTYARSQTTASGGTVLIKLFKEHVAHWYDNGAGGEAVVAGTVGGLCYLRDDHTVGVDDDTNTLSVAGRVWAIDTTLGVLVEPHETAGDRLGGLDA